MKLFTIILAISASLLVTGAAQAEQTPDGKMPKQLQQQHELALDQLATQGYFEQLDRVPVSQYMLQRIEDRRTEHEHQNKPMVAKTLGFQEISEYNLSRAPFAPNNVPQDVVKSGSTNYILPTNTKIRRIYTETDFGVLFVEQSIGEMVFDQPNMKSAGNDAKVVVTKHKNDTWATTLYASNAGYIYRIEADRALTGKDLASFVEFSEKIITNSK